MTLKLFIVTLHSLATLDVVWRSAPIEQVTMLLLKDIFMDDPQLLATCEPYYEEVPVVITGGEVGE